MTPVRGTARKAGIFASSLTTRSVTRSTLVARQTNPLGQRGREEIANLAEPLWHRSQVEPLRVEPRLDLAPAQRRGHRRAGSAAQRIRRHHRLRVRVLHAVE